MSGDKIRCAIETANLVVDQLQPIDKLGIVLYDANVRTLLSLQFVKDKDFIHRLINSITTDGATKFGRRYRSVKER
jgi:secreted protein with Ig-like and vWFA domain